MNNESHIDLERIDTWLDLFVKDEADSTYLCFLRMLAYYKRFELESIYRAIEREKKELKP